MRSLDMTASNLCETLKLRIDRTVRLRKSLGGFVNAALAEPIRAALPAFLFADFEPEAGWKPGTLPAHQAGIRLIQGTATVVAEKDFAQILQVGPSTPFAAVFVETIAVAKAPVAFCELLVRPAAVDEATDGEFLDFGGAIVGVFRHGQRGDLRVLYSRSSEESLWISSGLNFSLDDAGRVSDWLRIGIRLDRRTERWSLRVNDVEVLAGLRAMPGEAAGLPPPALALRAERATDMGR